MSPPAGWLAFPLHLLEYTDKADSSAAIASNLAKGMQVPGAVKAACRYIEAAIQTAPDFGKGNGPLNHFHSTYTLPFTPWVTSFFPAWESALLMNCQRTLRRMGIRTAGRGPGLGRVRQPSLRHGYGKRNTATGVI